MNNARLLAIAAKRVGKNPSANPSILAKIRVVAAEANPARNDDDEPWFRMMPKNNGGKMNGNHKFIDANTFSRMPLKYRAEISPAIPIKTVIILAIIGMAGLISA